MKPVTRMSVLTVLLGLFAAAGAVNFLQLVQEEWGAFKSEHNKQYSSEREDQTRMKNFVKNKLAVAKHNQLFQRGLSSYRLQLNKYSDMLLPEFLQTITGYDHSGDSELRGVSFITPANAEPPELVDWRQQGAVTAVRDQKECLSCWAFSAAGALEAQHFRKTGSLVMLSEQNLIDCSSGYRNHGCNQGNMRKAFQYIRDNRGIDTDASYPYEAVDDKCRYNAKNSGATDVGFVDLPLGDELSLKAAVAFVGPVSAAISVEDSFKLYREGVYFAANCSSDYHKLVHGILVVGYGTDEQGDDYWLVKNSWGTSWGDGGYGKMARNRDNHCGIASRAYYPLVY